MIFSQYPSHWIEAKIGYKYFVQLGKMLQPEPRDENDILKPYLRAANIFWDKIDLSDVNEMYFSPKEINKFSLHKSDLLVSEGGDVGRSCIWNNRAEMYFQNALNRIRERKNSNCTTQFLYYWLYHLKSCGYISMLCNVATISHYTAEKLKATFFVFPPFEEQQSIAQFLDYKTEQIDKLIEKKEKLLKLLEEKRIALITNAVTGKLNETILPLRKGETQRGFKDSGIPWLGKIPEHWKVKRLKFVSDCNQNSLNESTDPDYTFQYVDISSVDLIKGITNKETFTFEEAPSRARRIAKKGDTIISTVRTYLKAIARIEDEESDLIVSTGFAVISAGSKLNDKFLSYYLQSQSFVETIVSYSKGVSYPAIDAMELINLSMVVPPLDEQEAIVKYLDAELAKTDQLSEQVNKAIEKLKEYRTSLITSAVTGKLDLRNWQPN